MDILDDRNITSKHLGRNGLHLNKAGSTRLAKNIIYKLRKFWWSLEHLNESPARVSSNISRPPISCDSLNSNYIVSSKSFAKDEIISTKNLSITDVTKNSVNSKPLNNSKSLLNDQKNLGSNLHRVRIENPSRIIFGQININSMRNKFDLLMYIIKNEIDIFMISETKIDNSFQISQFTMTGYSIPLRLDRTSHGGGILLFVREDIPCRIIKTDCDADFKGILAEINLRKKKWFLCCSYNPHKSNITNHLKNICKTGKTKCNSWQSYSTWEFQCRRGKYCWVFKSVQFEKSS